MAVREHTLTHLLRNSGEVLAEVERDDIILRRRDGHDLFLGVWSRETSLRTALGVVARLLTAARENRDAWGHVTDAVETSMPWTTFLPEAERREFLTDLASTAAACVELDNFEPLTRKLEGWRAAAEIRANPELGKRLSSDTSGPPVRVKRPRAS